MTYFINHLKFCDKIFSVTEISNSVNTFQVLHHKFYIFWIINFYVQSIRKRILNIRHVNLSF